MRKEKRSGVNQAEPSGWVGAKPKSHGIELSQPNRNGEISPPPIRSVRSMDPTPPDPEVEEKPERRRFTAAYRARIVREADACTEKGQIGALLRREGLYSSQLCEWRKKYQPGALTALKDHPRGRRPPEGESPARGERETAAAGGAVGAPASASGNHHRGAKKNSAILGIPPTSWESDEAD